MMWKKILFAMLFGVTIPCIAGAEALSVRKLPLTVCYFGETITHPGLSVGTELSLNGNAVHNLFVTANIGSYLHVRNHAALFINTEFGYRITARSGYYFEVLAGAGYMHTWLDGTVYEIGDDGLVYEIADPGRPAFMPSVTVGLFGWDFSKKNLGNFRTFIRLQAFGQYPYNTVMLPHLALQAGVTYYFPTRQED